MLKPTDYSHLTAKNWADIAKKLLGLKEDQKLIMAVSDEHEGGVTSKIPDVKNVLLGFAQKADILLLNGDDYEYESPTALARTIRDLMDKYKHLPPAESRQELLKETVQILKNKVDEDISNLEIQIKENPDRKILKVIGNHENFQYFREKLQELEERHANFQWSPEVEIIRVPGAKKKKNADHILAVHGDLQMYDLGIVADGYTDKQRPNYTIEQMAEKALGIATNYWSPSAEKQEEWQGLVKLFRKPKTTAQTVYSELLFAAQCAEGLHLQKRNLKKADNDIDKLDLTERKLKKRRKKLTKSLDSSNDEERKETKKALAELEGKIEVIDEQRNLIMGKSRAFSAGRDDAELRVLYYKKLSDKHREKPKKPAKLLTHKVLEFITHINFGHTHVASEGVEIKGSGKQTIVASNNASVTGAIMTAPLDEKGRPAKKHKAQEKLTDLRNLGALLYITEGGKVKDIISLGRLFKENMPKLLALVREIPKPQETSLLRQEILDNGSRINPDNLRASQNQTGSEGIT